MAENGTQSIRIERLRRLADKFLNAADQYPRVFHCAATASSRERLKDLLPWSESHEVFADEWRNDSTDSDHHYRNHHDDWGYVLDSLATDVNLFAVDQHSISLGRELWVGAFGIERPEGISNDSDLEPRPEIDRFAELAVAAANEFTDAPLPQVTASGAEMLLRFDRTDSRWLSLVYSALSLPSAQLRVGLTVMTLPFDVFTSSAKAIELLASSSSPAPIEPFNRKQKQAARKNRIIQLREDNKLSDSQLAKLTELAEADPVLKQIGLKVSYDIVRCALKQKRRNHKK